jgi:2-phosphoglycerate kinase
MYRRGSIGVENIVRNSINEGDSLIIWNIIIVV